MLSESRKRRVRRWLSKFDWKFIAAGTLVAFLIACAVHFGR